MLSPDELANHVEAYRRGSIEFDDFEDWFRSESRGAYESACRALVGAVESALSKYRFQGINENQLREELANAVRPFAACACDAWPAPQLLEIHVMGWREEDTPVRPVEDTQSEAFQFQSEFQKAATSATNDIIPAAA